MYLSVEFTEAHNDGMSLKKAITGALAGMLALLAFIVMLGQFTRSSTPAFLNGPRPNAYILLQKAALKVETRGLNGVTNRADLLAANQEALTLFRAALDQAAEAPEECYTLKRFVNPELERFRNL